MAAAIFTDDVRFEPWWWQAAPPAARAATLLPEKIDVAVIGAGFTGLSAALELARAGRSVLVLEAGRPGEGASTRNGGMIGSGHLVGLAKLTRRYGRGPAVDLLNEGTAALEFTAALIEREGIACHFARSGRFRGAWRPADYEAMAREVEALKGVIELEAELVPRAEQHREIATEAYHGGVVYPRHGGLHPGLFHQGLMALAEAAGAETAGNTAVTAIRREARGFTVATERGRVAAGEVIVATNGYTRAASPRLRRRLIPVPSYVIATEELPDGTVERLIPGARMIVESRARHCYYRPSPDGRRFVFGGRASVSVIDPGQSGQILHRLMTGLFPELADVKISHSWRGFVAFSRDHLPHLGRGPDGLHYALGYSGSGVAMAPYLGHKVALQVLGRVEGFSPFDRTPFSAFPLYNGRPWFLPLAERYYRWKDRGDRAA